MNRHPLNRYRRSRNPFTSRGLQVTLALWLMASASWAEYTETLERRIDMRSGDVRVENLAGAITVEGGADAVEIIAEVHAEDRGLASSLSLDVRESGDRVNIRVLYPVDRHSTFHYDKGSKGNWRTKTNYQDERITVTGQKKGDAVTLWADITVRLPDGVNIDIDNAVGDLDASQVRGAVRFDTGSGQTRIVSGEGDVEVDSGSGNVSVENHRGDVEADTGSGNVMLSGIQGDVLADTGSGNVTLEDVAGDVEADTGSGSIELRDVRGALELDTGSGGIRGTGIVASGTVSADTSSGGVDLDGDFTDARSIAIDTGSGSITLSGALPAMELDIDTGSGGIDVDVPGLEILERDKDELTARTQGGGQVRVGLDSGSGSITVRGQ